MKLTNDMGPSLTTTNKILWKHWIKRSLHFLTLPFFINVSFHTIPEWNIFITLSRHNFPKICTLTWTWNAPGSFQALFEAHATKTITKKNRPYPRNIIIVKWSGSFNFWLVKGARNSFKHLGRWKFEDPWKPSWLRVLRKLGLTIASTWDGFEPQANHAFDLDREIPLDQCQARGEAGQLTGICLRRISPGWGFWPGIMHLICQFQRVDKK